MSHVYDRFSFLINYRKVFCFFSLLFIFSESVNLLPYTITERHTHAFDRAHAHTHSNTLLRITNIFNERYGKIKIRAGKESSNAKVFYPAAMYVCVCVRARSTGVNFQNISKRYREKPAQQGNKNNNSLQQIYVFPFSKSNINALTLNMTLFR